MRYRVRRPRRKKRSNNKDTAKALRKRRADKAARASGSYLKRGQRAFGTLTQKQLETMIAAKKARRSATENAQGARTTGNPAPLQADNPFAQLVNLQPQQVPPRPVSRPINLGYGQPQQPVGNPFANLFNMFQYR